MSTESNESTGEKIKNFFSKLFTLKDERCKSLDGQYIPDTKECRIPMNKKEVFGAEIQKDAKLYYLDENFKRKKIKSPVEQVEKWIEEQNSENIDKKITKSGSKLTVIKKDLFTKS